ncbi:MAG TPA: hypothetical protein DCG19_09085 [Cryomorphaceae bacterium]|nr:hypothetical protein [Owenweeksia sp.]MBF98945.1 hypothetical protein [Owenweeksia sp.]HAD97548.1 hypothetical protein [Cryomorphaceae bacterium]HBF19914.1 hypothetical protein [Cryomorphaceae bacterium]|tara:strand:- start:1425 stop:1856 length:432 start_codon:yes stop_codon:yes gene_type:complete
MKKQIVALMALIVVGMSSCNKDDDKKNVAEEKPKTKVELLTSKTWNMESISVTEETDSTSSEYEFPMPGTVTFKTDNKVVTKIAGEEDEVSSWALSEKGLVIDGETYELLELSETKLHIKEEIVEEDEDLGRVTVTTVIKMSH